MEITKKSPLLDEKEIDQVDSPNYSEKEEIYLRGLRKRLETARNARDQSHDELDGMSYAEYFNLNERLANTFIEPKKNKEDNNFQSGTIRTKLFALLSSVANLDLAGDISALDKNNLPIQSMGDAMEDVILKTNELDNDDEKKLLRQYELLKQGTCFVEEVWDERKKKAKKMEGKFKGKLNVEWTTKIEDAFARPSRNIIPGINVYLGDISKYDIKDQPFIFTVDKMPYSEAELVFGTWDRWDNVPKSKTSFEDIEASSLINWRLLEEEKDMVEIVRYQDKWNNEYAILVNGVLMTPAGLPMPWGYDEYNIAQQNLEPIHTKFAYGKSLVFRIRNKVAILDELMKLAVLKTQKSFMPPRYNISGRILTSRVFMPGKINHGIPPNSLPPIEGEADGLDQAELAMIEQMQGSIDSETTSPIFQGQQPSGNPTATEIVELQRQAKQMLGLTIFAVSMLEWKLEWLRLQNLLVNWFNPTDTVVDAMRGEVKNKYREVSVQRPIEGEGMGTRMVIPTDEVPTDGNAIMQAEDIYSKEIGQPVRFIFMNPEEVKSSKLCWQIVITPREKRTNETAKLLFRAEMADAQMFGPLLNIPYLAERFATVWQEDPTKMFKTPEQLQMEQQQQMAQEQQMAGGAGQPVSPRQKLPTPEKAMGREMNSALGVAQ